MIVSSEAAGPLSFGRQGVASGFFQGKFHISSGTGTYKVSQEFVSLLSSKPKIATFCWPKWSQLSKAEVQGSADVARLAAPQMGPDQDGPPTA